MDSSVNVGSLHREQIACRLRRPVFRRGVDRSGARQREKLRAAHTANAVLTGRRMREARYAGIVSPPCGFPPPVLQVGRSRAVAPVDGLGRALSADSAENPPCW
jgi:hypothetical protein